MEKLIKKTESGRDIFGNLVIGSYELIEDTPANRAKAKKLLYEYQETGLEASEIRELKTKLEQTKNDVVFWIEAHDEIYEELEQSKDAMNKLKAYMYDLEQEIKEFKSKIGQ